MMCYHIKVNNRFLLLVFAMLRHNFFLYSGQITLKILGEIVYFPIWWYGPGLVRTIRKLGLFWLDQGRMIGFSVWLRNIFVPMYGQSDLAGRLISFVMRLIQVVLRGTVLLFWLAFVLAALCLWIALPPAIALSLAAQISSLSGGL